jgi:hypothetical protein
MAAGNAGTKIQNVHRVVGLEAEVADLRREIRAPVEVAVQMPVQVTGIALPVV